MDRFRETPNAEQRERREKIEAAITEHQQIIVESGLGNKVIDGIFSSVPARDEASRKPEVAECAFGVRILSAARGYETVVITAEWDGGHAAWNKGELARFEDGTLDFMHDYSITPEEVQLIGEMANTVDEFTDPSEAQTVWGRGLRDSPEPGYL